MQEKLRDVADFVESLGLKGGDEMAEALRVLAAALDAQEEIERRSREVAQ